MNNLPQTNNSQIALEVGEILSQRIRELKETKGKVSKITSELESSRFATPPTEISIDLQQAGHQIYAESIIPSQQEINKKEELDRLSRIQEQISQLEKELRNSQNLEAEITKLQDRLEKYQIIVQEYKEDNKTLERQLRIKEENVKVLSEQLLVVDELKENLFRMSYQLKQTEIELEKFRNRAENSSQNVKELEESLAKTTAESASIQTKLKESEESLQGLKSYVSTELEPELEKTKQNLNLQSEKAELSAKLNQSIAHLSQSIDRMKSENIELRDSIYRERDLSSQSHLQAKDIDKERQNLYIELVIIAEDAMRSGKLIEIHDEEIKESVYSLALQHIIKLAKNNDVTKKELYAIFNIFEDREVLRTALRSFGGFNVGTIKGKSLTINEILSSVEEGKIHEEDSIGLYRYLI